MTPKVLTLSLLVGLGLFTTSVYSAVQLRVQSVDKEAKRINFLRTGTPDPVVNYYWVEESEDGEHWEVWHNIFFAPREVGWSGFRPRYNEADHQFFRVRGGQHLPLP